MLEKIYDPSIVEDKLYKKWEDSGYFHEEVDKNKKPFTIMMPPPNITGQLHMGHALDNTIQDILTRYKRMQGYNILWMPGTDHASIATEVKIVNKLKDEGIDKNELGREKFLEHAWKWKDEYGGIITQQLRKLGTSCDWRRERFTMDDGLSDAVAEVFINLYNKGYIYKGSRIINWCPVCQTSISDAEVIHEEKDGHFYHLNYKIINPSGDEKSVHFATTRPETLLGDTAVAVNPEDKRYAHLVGKTVLVPFVNREIPIIADDYVDMDFGTGVVKITPYHDPNDFEVGQRHNLKEICVMNDDGTMNSNAAQFEGMTLSKAREEILKELDKMGQLDKIEPHVHNVGIHDRCNCVIEPMVKEQWFVRMKELAEPAIKALETGDLNFVPERFGKTYLRWLENIRDWCISRQLWWGHRIPAYYCKKCGEIVVSKNKPETCKCGCKEFIQDEDTLDTWFSSALWPFSTLGWPEQTEELKHFYPTSVLVTGYDIIFFWVVRMVFSGLEQMGAVPFKDVLIHGLIRDSQGRKMSKSLGNGIDPLDVIHKYGADALRLTLVTGNAPGNDMRFYFERVEVNRNFLNKLWNATRFILMNCEDDSEEVDLSIMPKELTATDKWILSKANNLINIVDENLDKYELGLAVGKVHDFAWEEFCDWYIEMVKPRLYNKEDPTRSAALYTLKTVMIDILKMLHPFIPFVTEEIFLGIQNSEQSIMMSTWPKFTAEKDFATQEKEIETIKDAVRQVRNLRTEMNVPPSKKATIYVVSDDLKIRNIFTNGAIVFKTLAFASEVRIQKDMANIPGDAVSIVVLGAVIYIPLSELLDIKKEIERLTKEKDKYESEIARVTKKLSNEGFVKKAPTSLIEEEKAKRERFSKLSIEVTSRITKLSAM
ncbi:MAG: valine--tRNA ligase [Candidatus Epulonipiscioides saccharophilum]|nr:MAG: valine--tRNA ligase [Epulopiscium sp. AS2M-Bin001]